MDTTFLIDAFELVFSGAGILGYLGWGYVVCMSIIFLTLDPDREAGIGRALNLVAFWGISGLLISVEMFLLTLPLMLVAALDVVTNETVNLATLGIFLLAFFATPTAVLWCWVGS